jgi:hypothetical protein
MGKRGCYPCKRESIGFRPEPVVANAWPFRSMVDFFQELQQRQQLDQVMRPERLEGHELQAAYQSIVDFFDSCQPQPQQQLRQVMPPVFQEAPELQEGMPLYMHIRLTFIDEIKIMNKSMNTPMNIVHNN